MIQRPELEDRVGGLIQIETYKGGQFELDGWDLKTVLDDILMVQYIDINEEGDMVKRGSMWVPINAVHHIWRIGVVVLAGPRCQTVKIGDHIVFPNDKGIQISNLNGLKNIVFLNESRIFGVCELKSTKKEKPNSNKNKK